MDSKKIVYSLPIPCVQVPILSRPSKSIKSPYCADIMKDDKPYIAHTPSLGCCKLVDAGCEVYVQERTENNTKTQYAVYGTKVDHNITVGVHPMVANPMMKAILVKRLQDEWKDIILVKSEVVYKDSRIDFCAQRANGKKVWIEVKNVPLAAYEDKATKDYRSICVPKDGQDPYAKMAIFPDGYRKHKEDPVSPRATKHLATLADCVAQGDEAYCVYITQRSDVLSFTPSKLDQVYRNQFITSQSQGVQMRCYCVGWDDDFHHAYFLKQVPIVL